MRSTKQRLEQGLALLQTIERKREETRTPSLGAHIEWSVIQRELDELERDILEDPGALEKFLVRIRRREP